MYGNLCIYVVSFMLFFLDSKTNQTSRACECLVVVNGWGTGKPKLLRLAIKSTATSLALTAPSGVPLADGVDRVAIVVCALVRMIKLGEAVRTRSTKKGRGNTYVPLLISSESLACFFASIMYNPLPKTACSISSQM